MSVANNYLKYRKAEKSSRFQKSIRQTFFFITHPPAQSNVYQKMYFCFYNFKKQQQQQQKKKPKEEKKIYVENLMRYDNIGFEFALCNLD